MIATAPIQRVPARQIATRTEEPPFATIRATLADLGGLVHEAAISPSGGAASAIDAGRRLPPAKQPRRIRRPTLAID